jgi:hypothetical protein
MSAASTASSSTTPRCLTASSHTSRAARKVNRDCHCSWRAARSLPRSGPRRVAADHSREQTMTGTHRSPRATRATLWLPGLAVALGAAVATAHGLYEVAVAAAVPAGIAWLYPLITDGLALVAYGATNRLTGSGARYAWAVVVIAAGLSGLAQAVYLASGATLDASPTLRFGIGAWPAVAAAVAAHLLYLLAALGSTDPGDELKSNEVAGLPSTYVSASVRQVPSNRPVVQPRRQTQRTRPDVQARHPCYVQPWRPPIQTICPPARARPRPGPGRALPPYGTPHATAPSRLSPRSQLPPTSPAAPPLRSSNHSAVAIPYRRPDSPRTSPTSAM